MLVTRRQLLQECTAISLGANLPGWLSRPLLAQAVNPLIRYDVNGASSEAKASVAAYRTGVAIMKGRKAHDPTSWLFQANIHSWPGQFGLTASDPEEEFRQTFSPQNTQGLAAAEKARREQLARSLWGTCTHGDPAVRFLPWHRVYLFFIERIVRAAGGLDGSSLGLPYWNWTKDRALPLAFREEVDGKQENNSLYWANRRQLVNRAVNPISIPAVSVRVANILDLPDFSPTFSPQAGLGFSNQLEDGPHGNVHVWIQTPPRGMGSFEEAARDPIFWLHHCNIDRLWVRWKNLDGSGTGHRDPVDAPVLDSNSTWGDVPQTFVDVDGQPKTLTARQILIAAEILDRGYIYDDMTAPSGSPVIAMAARAAEAPSGGPVPGDAGERTVASSGPMAVTGRSTIMLERPSGPTSAAVTSASQIEPRTLVLKNIVAQDLSTPSYGVYLNLPENTNADPAGPYFAGTLNIFNAQAANRTMARPESSGSMEHTPHRMSAEVVRRLPVAPQLQEQLTSGLWNGGDITITLAPIVTGDTEEQAPTSASGDRSSIGLTIGGIELLGR